MQGDALPENRLWYSEIYKSYKKFQLALEVGISKNEQVPTFWSNVSLIYPISVFQNLVGKTILKEQLFGKYVNFMTCSYSELNLSITGF